MQNNVSTKRNYLYNVICEFITTLIPLITTPHVSRALGTGGMGAYQYVMTVASYFVLFANCGIRVYGCRRIAAIKDDIVARSRIFSSIFYQQVMLSLLVGALYTVFTLTAAPQYRLLFAVFGINLLSVCLEITWLYHGMESFAPVAFCTIVTKAVSAAAIFGFVKTEADLPLYALFSSLSVIAIQLYLWLGARRFVRFVRVKGREIFAHFLPCLVLLLPTLAPTLFRTMDKFMLEKFTNADAVGLYGAAEQLQTCMLGFITGLGVVMLPRISHLLAKGQEKDANEFLSSSMQFSVFLGAAITFGIAAVSNVFVPYYYGESFAEAASLTLIFSPTILMISWADVIRTQYIIPHKRDRIFVVSIISGALVNFVCNIFLIPYFADRSSLLGLSYEASSTLGALPGTLAADFTVILVQYLFLRRELPFGRYLRLCAVFLFAGVAMFASVRFVGAACQATLGISSPLLILLLQVLSGGVVYLAIVGIWYYAFRRDTLRALLKK